MKQQDLMAELRAIITCLEAIPDQLLRRRADDVLCQRFMVVLSGVVDAPRRLRLPPSDDIERKWGATFFTVLSKALALELFIKEAGRDCIRE